MVGGAGDGAALPGAGVLQEGQGADGMGRRGDAVWGLVVVLRQRRSLLDLHNLHFVFTVLGWY